MHFRATFIDIWRFFSGHTGCKQFSISLQIWFIRIMLMKFLALEATQCTAFATTHNTLVFRKWTIPGLFFFIFVFSIQLTVNNIQYNKFRRCLDSNGGPLDLEANAPPTESQPLPNGVKFRYLNLTLLLVGHFRPLFSLFLVNTIFTTNMMWSGN